MALYDLSYPLCTETPVFPGDEPVRVRLVADLATGGAYAARRLELGTHSGTHVDAPAHLLSDGATVDALPLGLWVGPALLLDADALLETALGGVERLLLAGVPDGLSPDQAAALASSGVRLVGVDGPSADAIVSEDLPAHRRLLAAGTVIVENLRLAGVPRGPGTLYCLPLLVENGDGAPCRVLWEPE